MELPYILSQNNNKLDFNVCQYLPYVRLFKKITTTDEGRIDLSACRLLVCDEVGVGKTVETGIIVNELRYGELFYKKGLRILIVCPAKLKLNWKKELDKLTGINTRIYDSKLPHFYHTTVIGYDELKNYVGNHSDDLPLIDVLIVDEAHYLRNSGKGGDNSEGRRGAIEALIQKKEKDTNGATRGMMKLFLSGTPIFNKEEDLETLARLMGIDVPEPQEKGEEKPPLDLPATKTTKAAAHCEDNSEDGGDIKMITRLPIYELCEIVIPDGAEKNVFLACCPPAKDTEDDEDFDEEIDAENYEDDENKEMLGNIRQYCANSVHYLNFWAERQKKQDSELLNDVKDKLKKWRKDRTDTKLTYLQGLLKDLKDAADNNQEPFKAVIFVEHPETANYLKENLNGFGTIAILSGSTEKPALETKLFRESASDYIMICTKAAQEGHNFQFCPNLIHYEFPFTPAAIWQRNGRIDRKGQKHNPHIFYFKTVCLADNGNDVSYDERYYNILLNKMKAIEKNQSLIPYSNILPRSGNAEDKLDYSGNDGKVYVDEYKAIKNEVLNAFSEEDQKTIRAKIKK